MGDILVYYTQVHAIILVNYLQHQYRLNGLQKASIINLYLNF